MSADETKVGHEYEGNWTVCTKSTGSGRIQGVCGKKRIEHEAPREVLAASGKFAEMAPETMVGHGFEGPENPFAHPPTEDSCFKVVWRDGRFDVCREPRSVHPGEQSKPFGRLAAAAPATCGGERCSSAVCKCAPRRFS